MTGLMDTDRAARCREGLKSDRDSYDGADPAGRVLSRADLVVIFETLAAQASVSARRDAAMFAILAMGGLRRAEVCGLDLADWNSQSEELLVRQGKGGRTRKVWLHEGAVEALEAWLALRGSAAGPLLAHVNKGGRITPGEEGRLSPHAVWKRTKRLASAAQISDFAPHDFRRLMVTQLLDAGQDLVAVSRLAGHSQVTTTARYDRRGERAARKASAALDLPYVPPAR